MLTQRLSLTNQDAQKVSDTQLHALGSIAETADGRVFRYTGAGATALAAGKVTIAPAKVANHTNVAVAVAANVGDTQVTLTLGATAATVNQYKDGYLVINDADGVGQTLRINGHAAAASSGSLVISLEDPLATALTTSSKACLVYNPWSNAAISSSAAALVTTGAPVVAVAASSFYWSQTGGTASVLSAGIITKGANAIVSAAVNGALTIQVDASVTQVVGFAPEATVDTKYYPVYLTVD